MFSRFFTTFLRILRAFHVARVSFPSFVGKLVTNVQGKEHVLVIRQKKYCTLNGKEVIFSFCLFDQEQTHSHRWLQGIESG